jgi:hypothetical protein
MHPPARRKGKSPAIAAVSKGRTMEEKLSLREATVQEIQLELVRRTRFNGCNPRNARRSLGYCGFLRGGLRGVANWHLKNGVHST